MWSRRESDPRPLECHAKAEVYGRCATVRNRARNQALASVQAARRARSRTVRPAQYPHTHLSPFARRAALASKSAWRLAALDGSAEDRIRRCRERGWRSRRRSVRKRLTITEEVERNVSSVAKG